MAGLWHDRRVRRSATAGIALLAPALLHIHIHHPFHGAPIDYVGVAAASAASWIGVPGPGEPLLLAAGILAAKHELDLGAVVVVAWLAATAGGIAGWAIGLKAGRALFTAPGPLRWLRIKTVQRGEEIFDRHPVIAIVMTPSFVAGIHRVPSRVYQPINVISAAVWAAGIGVGGYLVGPPVLDVFSDAGTLFSVIIIVVIAAIVGLELWRRHHRSARDRGEERGEERGDGRPV
jgi:membrane protein DedA with SNARE-associated domain